MHNLLCRWDVGKRPTGGATKRAFLGAFSAGVFALILSPRGISWLRTVVTSIKERRRGGAHSPANLPSKPSIETPDEPDIIDLPHLALPGSATSSERVELSLLVHNVGHTDMLISIAPVSESGLESSSESVLVLARPRFSHVKSTSELLRDFITASPDLVRIARFPLLKRDISNARYALDAPSPGRQLPVGLRFAPGCGPILSPREACTSLKVHRDGQRFWDIDDDGTLTGASALRITGVPFDSSSPQ